MPLVSISTQLLRKLVGKSLTRDELIAALEQLGNNVEGYASATFYRCDRCGHVTEALEPERPTPGIPCLRATHRQARPDSGLPKGFPRSERGDFGDACAGCGSRDVAVSGSTEVIRISLLPVRPDMFDAAGLSRALRGYLGIETGLPSYRLEPSGFAVRVQPGLENIRPYIVGCAVRGLVMDDETVKTIMKMQENLHWALGRDRRRASIGVYDLDAVEPDFEYSAVAPDGVEFVPLFGMPGGMVAATPKEILEQHPKGAAYKHLLDRFPMYPLLSDSGGRVLSMPPIINSEDTRVTPKTRNLLVDVTGPDKNAITRTIAVIATGLADLGARIETAQVIYPDGTRETTPDLSPTRVTLDLDSVGRVLGFEVPDTAAALERMRYGVKPEGRKLILEVPAYRSDVMHEYDVIEDVAIAHGYHNIRPRLVPTMTVGSHQPIEDLSETARRVMTGLGFLETMTLVLTNEKEHYEMLGQPVTEPYPRVENPASVEQDMLRGQLLAGLLSTFRVNSTREMPQHIFEVGDCFELDPEAETGARVRRKLAVGMAGPRTGFADIRAVAEALARELSRGVRFGSVQHPAFITGRAAAIFEAGGDKAARCGVLGEVHPEVLGRFGIGQPVALLEIDLSGML